MAKDVLITPTDGLIQFSSSVGSGSGQIKVDGDDLVISNLVGDVLLGDGASDIFVGDGTNNVDIVFEQNGEIRDDGSGKNLTIGSKTTNVFVTGSSSLILQKQGGSVGLGTVTTDSLLHISGAAVSENLFHIEGSDGIDALFATGSGRIGIGTVDPQNPLSVSGSLTVFNLNETSRLTVGEADDSGVTTSNALIIETTGASNKSHTFTIGTGNDYIVEALGNKSDIHLSAFGATRFGVNNGSAYNFTQQMILTGSTGNLGIGIATPSKKLTVEGDISASGNIFLGAMGATFISMSSADGLVSASFFSGSFGGDGSGLTNITSTAEVDIDGLDALGGTGIAQSDKLMFSDDGTEKSITFSNLEDAIFGNVSGDATIAAGGALTIAADSVEGTMLNTNAADTSTMELSSDSLSVLKVPNALTAGVGITAAGTFDGAAARTFSVDSASFAPFFSSSMNDLDVQGNISGSLGSTGSFGHIKIPDGSGGIHLGSSNDLQIYHNGSNSFIQDTGTGKLILDTNGTDVRITKTDSEFMAKFITDGAVELYHNHIKKFETTALGIDVTGNIDASSHITASGDISSSGTFTSDGVNSSAAVLPVTSNGAALGSTSLQWSDLFLASGGVINFNNGDITLTHSATAQQLKLNGGSLNVNSNITASGDISSSLASTGSFGALHTTGDISGSGTGSFSNIKVSNMPAGADNSVVILDSDGFLKTDEVDSRIFDGTNLLGAQSSPTDGYFLISDDGRSLADSIMNQDSSNIGIGIATPEQKLTVHGNISSSGTIFANDYGGNVSGSLTSTGSFGKGFFDGRVGINDNTPGFQLDVNGTFRSTGYARADGGVYANDFFHAIGGDGFTFDSHITASGDISASGNYIGDRQFDKTSNTDADARGDIVYIGGTTSMDNGKIYHYKSDGTWELADADAVANCDGLLAVALGAASDTNGMLLRGTVTLDHDPGAVGDVLFLATGGTGQATATAPSGNTDIVRVIGYCLDASNGQIWFNPDNTFVEVSA